MARRKRNKEIYLMPEPNWLSINNLKTEEEKLKLCRDFEYFVHYEIPDKKAGATIFTWLEKDSGLDKNLIKKLKKVPDVWFSSFAKHTFIWVKTQGYMHPDVRAHLLSKIPALEDKAETIIEEKEIKQADAKPKISIQQRMREQVSTLCGTWDGILDETLEHAGDFKSFDPYTEMRVYAGGVIKPNHAKIVKDMYLGEYAEAQEVIEWKDPDIKEAYGHFSLKQRKLMLEFYEKINKACDTFIETGKATRKPRKPKAVSREKQVAKLKYQQNCPELGIASINPIEIIDATDVWVYNTKTRKLGLYKVGGLQSGMTVKGTSIQHFEVSKSVQKTLRKPAEQLKLFKGTAKTKYQKAFDDINAVEIKLNGRLNDTTIILKAF
jgi:hypothetical protein